MVFQGEPEKHRKWYHLLLVSKCIETTRFLPFFVVWRHIGDTCGWD